MSDLSERSGFNAVFRTGQQIAELTAQRDQARRERDEARSQLLTCKYHGMYNGERSPCCLLIACKDREVAK